MKLKCIGGELDGYRYEIEDHLLNDREQITLPKPISGLRFASDPAIFPDTIESSQLYYKILVLHFNEKGQLSKQYYLIPIDWSYREAVLYQFGK